MNNVEQCQNFIHEFSFGLIVSHSLFASHLPFVLHENESSMGVLYSHCAKANAHWKAFNNKEVLIVFNGPHSYISPRWYAHLPAVPTWNYASVHVYGKVSLLNKNETLAVVDNTVKKYEPDLLTNEDIMTDHYKEKLLSAIIGFKITISKIEGKLKLGQHKQEADQVGVYTALLNSSSLDDQILAKYMKKINVGIG